MRMRTMLKRKIKLICNWSTAAGVRMGDRGGNADMWQGYMQEMEVGVVDRPGPQSSQLCSWCS